ESRDAVIIDDEIQPLLGDAPSFQLSHEALASMRGTPMSTAAADLSGAVERTDHVVSDDPNVIVRVHRPKGVEGPLPCIYSIHGGGGVLGSFSNSAPHVSPSPVGSPVRGAVVWV